MTGHPGREGPDRPLEGLGTFAWKLSLATVVAVAAVALYLLVRGDRGDVPSGPAPSVSATRGPGSAEATPAARRVAILEPSNDVAESPVGRDVDRRYAQGELSEARRTFEPCRGGDLRRVAWFDAQQRVRKLIQVRETGMVVEQWFDQDGRLREALVRTTAGGRAFSRRITFDERGHESVVDTPREAVADEPPPSLVHADPTSAFFAGPGCSG